MAVSNPFELKVIEGKAKGISEDGKGSLGGVGLGGLKCKLMSLSWRWGWRYHCRSLSG